MRQPRGWVRVVPRAGPRAACLTAWCKQVRVMRRLEHRNLVSLLDCFQEKDAMYLVMDLVAGRDLYDRYRSRPTPTP